MNLYSVTFEDGTTLEYTKAAGSAAPLFLSKSLMKGLGYASSAPGVLYSPGFKKYIITQPLKRGKKPLLLVHLNGVLKLISSRHPVWESEFLARFLVYEQPREPRETGPLLVDSPHSPHSPPLITPDKSESPLDLLGRQVKFEGKIRREMKKLGDKITQLTDIVTAPAPAPVIVTPPAPAQVDNTITVDTVAVPKRRKKGVVRVPVDHTVGFTMTTNLKTGKPIFTHVEGYRTYKEMLRVAGMEELIATIPGRALSRALSYACRKHGFPVYDVVDGSHYGGKRNKNRVRRHHMTSYTVKAYPIKMWDVIEPIAQEKLDKLTDPWEG